MKLYVYVLADRAIDIADLRGIRDEGLAIVELLEGIAIAGDASAAPDASRPALEAQDRLVRALHDRAPALLPMRFGTIVSDALALREHPTLQPAVLTHAFAEVRGREQMTLRVATNRPTGFRDDADAEPGGAGAGRRYLERRARAVAPPAEVRPLVESVAALVRAERYERGRVPGLLGTVYHLIDRGRAADYRAAMGARAGFEPSLTMAVAGPSPAYAFGPAVGA